MIERGGDGQGTQNVRRSSRITWLIGLGALFSGTALVIHILSGFSLRLALALTGGILLFVIISIWHRATDEQRAWLLNTATVGTLSGLLATAAYDAAKMALSQWDASPYNPFEAIRIFGVLLAGSSAPRVLVFSAGTMFHFLNGITFGVAFCFFFERFGSGRRGIVVGTAWGLFLELFQLTLYPGWLDIRFYNEFVQISALSHVVYGAVLGLLCQNGLRYWHIWNSGGT